jgi:methylphosphotriester-DNA--protein-cysteine methyltransferase
MDKHISLGTNPFARSRKLYELVKNQSIALGGNSKLKIYGRLECASSKRMKAENRVFFANEQEAINKGYRPCAKCMPQQYGLWKAAIEL